MTMITDDVDGFDDIDMLQTGTDTELCPDLVLILTLRFAGSSRTKLLYSIDSATCFTSGAYEANCATRSGTEYATPFSILFGEVGVSGF